MPKNFAHLKSDSPFYGIHPHGLAKSLVTTAVNLEGDPETEAYMLDVAQCSIAQIDRIAELVAKQCNAQPADVLASLKAGIDMPIRASQVACVSSDARAFL